MAARKPNAAERAARSRYTWDERAGRYRGPGGRYVSARDVRGATDGALDAANTRIRGVSSQLRAGSITAEEWALAMRAEIKRVHLWSAAAARGGWAQMTPADFGRVGAIVRRQYEYLNGFARQIAAGLPLDGRFLSRASMYGEAGRGTFEHFNRLERAEHGEEEVRNVLGNAEHCPDCFSETARGWVAADDMSLPGSRQCRSKCKCRLEYRTAGED
jgi:hypothetical protein